MLFIDYRCIHIKYKHKSLNGEVFKDIFRGIKTFCRPEM